MAIDVSKTLRKALVELQTERERLDQQIATIESALAGVGGRRGRGAGRGGAGQRKRGRKTMSAAARKAMSKRMKSYWAKRRVEARKAKAEAAK